MQEYIKCPLCGREVRVLNLTHLSLHGYTNKQQFIKEYPDCPLFSERHSYEQSKRSKQMYVDHPELSEVSRNNIIKINKSEEQKAKASVRAAERNCNDLSSLISNEEYVRNKEFLDNIKEVRESKIEELASIPHETYNVSKQIQSFNKGYKNSRISGYITPHKIVTLRSKNEKQFLDILNDLGIDYYYESLRVYYIGEDGLRHYYIPDVYIPEINLVLELKYKDYDLEETEFKLKREATINMGYNFIAVTHSMLFDNSFINLMHELCPTSLVE